VSQGRVTQIKKGLYTIWRKVKWMVLAFLAPEVLLGAAVLDLLSAMTSVRNMMDFAAEDGVEWGLGHGFLANMGGFAVCFGDAQETVSFHGTEALAEGNNMVQVGPHVLSSEALDSQMDPQFENRPKANDPAKQESGTNRNEKSTLQFPGLRLDEEIIDDGSIDDTDMDNMVPAEEATFSSFNLVWGSKRQKRKLDAMASLSALAKRNKSQPWNIGPGMGWKPNAQNVFIIKQGLYRLRNSPVQFIMPQYLNLASLQGNTWILDARQLYYARKWGIIDLPDISEEELEDKSKSDVLVKSIALLEITWLVVGLVARRVKRHPSTQLEIMTLAISACSVITYCLLIRKPKDIAIPVAIRARRHPKPSEMLTLANFGPTPWFDAILFEKWTTGRTNFWIPNTVCHYVEFSSNWLKTQRSRYGAIWMGSTVGTSILGGLHALAWESTFPTKAERVAWRFASILTVAMPWAYMVLGNFVIGVLIFFATLGNSKDRKSNGTWKEISSESNPFSYYSGAVMRFPDYVRVYINSYYVTLSFFVISVYTVARLFLIVEAFRSLGFLPSAAYIATWGW
jgi:hypothetical protein